LVLAGAKQKKTQAESLESFFYFQKTSKTRTIVISFY
jgi:hypothetical protein